MSSERTDAEGATVKRVIYLYSREVSYGVLIHCAGCKKGTVSRHRTTMHEVMRAEALHDHLDRCFNRTTPDIPVGWCMNGRNNVLCDKCKEKAR